jgi:hypothetical protein
MHVNVGDALFFPKFGGTKVNLVEKELIIRRKSDIVANGGLNTMHLFVLFHQINHTSFLNK